MFGARLFRRFLVREDCRRGLVLPKAFGERATLVRTRFQRASAKLTDSASGDEFERSGFAIRRWPDENGLQNAVLPDIVRLMWPNPLCGVRT
jgi:hypothetical protein